MQEKVRNYFAELGEKFRNLEKSQKIRLIATIAISIIALAVAIFWIAKPKRVVLLAGQDFSTVSSIQAALDEQGIYNRAVKDGTSIVVNEKDSNRAKIALAEKNVFSGNRFTYEDALAASGMTSTDIVKNENFKRVKASDLSEMLRGFSGVTDATVTLVLPESDNYFLQPKDESSAGIVLNVTPEFNREITPTAVARLITQSVEGLKLENIEITDTNGTSLYSGIKLSESGSINSEYDMELVRKNELDGTIRSILSPLYDEVKVVSNLRINWDEIDVINTEYRNANEEGEAGLISTETTASSSVEGADSPNEPGLLANDNATDTYQMGGDATYSGSTKDRNVEYVHNKIQTSSKEGRGKLVPEESSLLITAYKYRPYNQEYIERTERANNSNFDWETFKEQNTQETLTGIEPTLLAGLRVGTGIDNIEVVTFEIPVFYDKVVTPVNYQEIAIFAILALLILLLAYGLIRRAQPDDITDVERPLDIDEVIAITEGLEPIDDNIPGLEPIDFDKDSQIKREIEKFVDEKPEAVAQLLRNWLNDEWE